MSRRPRSILAPNASPMTMGGTVTYVVGERRVAVIDPGCREPSHLAAIVRAVGDAEAATILVTHDHPDHAEGAEELARRLAAPLLAAADGALPDGARIRTDHGDLVAVATPGHTPDHVALHWPDAEAIFCGDLMMGGIDTAVVAAPEGDVGDYLDSLEKLRRLGPRLIYPAHGPAFTDPADALDRYRRHREERQRQVLAAVARGARTVDSITTAVYGESLEPALRELARAAVRAYVAHLRRTGRLEADVTP